MSIRTLMNELIKCSRDLDSHLQLINGLSQEVEKVTGEIQNNFQGSDTLEKLLTPLQNTKNTLRKTDTEIKLSQEKLKNLQAKLRG